MTAALQPSPAHLLVAIDVAKRFHDVVVRWPDGRERAFKVQSTLDDHEALCTFLVSHNLPVIAAMEPTADFHRTLAWRLAEAGIEVHLASSLAGARVREALYTSWDKHDRKDAKVLMYLLAHGMTKPFHDPLRGGFFDVQELSNTYHQIVQARSRCQHSLINHYLTLYFPEMERYLHTTRAAWFCRFLLAFPTPSSITTMDPEAFIAAAWDVVGRKVQKRRFLQELYETASRSIGLPIPEDSLATETFRLQLERYLALTEQRQHLEAQANNQLGEHPDFKRLQTMPGVGPIIALMILAESGDLRRFPHHRQYLKFCGFDLAASQSGSQCSKHRLSKRGNARLRYAYWLAATVAIRRPENSFRAKYERYIRSDPNSGDLKRKATTAIAAKMARVAHALVKRESEYRGYYEYAVPGGGTPLSGP